MKPRALINPKVLEWARVDRGFDIDEAARKIRISPKKLEKCESGEESLTLPQFRRAAQVYRRPTAIFFLKKVPESQEPPEFRRMKYSRDLPLSPQIRLELRRIYYRKKVAENLIDYGPEYDWAFVGSISIQDDPEEIGLLIRKMLEIPDEYPKGFREHKVLNLWRRRVENLGVLVFAVPKVDVVEMRGFALAKTPFPVIAFNRRDAPQARLFSLLHEFTHVLLGESTICEVHDSGSNAHRNGSIGTLCHHARGSGLMPSASLIETSIVRNHGSSPSWSEKDIRRISSRFNVSRPVALRRLLILGRTTHEFYSSKIEEWEMEPPRRKRRTGGGESIAERVIRLLGYNYVNLIMNAMNGDAISLTDVSEIFDMKLKHLHKLEESILGSPVAVG